MSDERQRPEWAPKEGGEGFTSHVMKGVDSPEDSQKQEAMRMRRGGVKRRQLSEDDYVDGILSGDRTILARAITLVESNSPRFRETAAAVLKRIQPEAGKSLRVGITGVPGAGKSTLIEALGGYLCEEGSKVAVLAVDPSSTRTGGSILGDKTRMESLTRHPNAFIRPSPSGGALGGVARKSRETMILCEAAGFDTVLIETVGVGQSEVTVRSMVDFFLLVQIAGAGDELQGLKKGVIEIADAILVNKADGDNKRRALAAKAEYNRVLHYLQEATPGWRTKAYTASAQTGEGVPDLWKVVLDFTEKTRETGVFEERRRTQNIQWTHALIEEGLKGLFFEHPKVKDALADLEPKVAAGDIPAAVAVESLLQKFRESFRDAYA